VFLHAIAALATAGIVEDQDRHVAAPIVGDR
jgi:hypothetical protein